LVWIGLSHREIGRKKNQCAKEDKKARGIIVGFHESMKGMADAGGRRAQCVAFVMWF
jgi:hypothetical protein